MMPALVGGGTGSFLRQLWLRKWSIVIIAGVAAFSAMYFTSRQPPIYAAESKVLVEPIDDRPLNMQTEHELVRSMDVTRLVLDRLDVRLTAEELLDDLSIGTPSGTEILELTYTASTRDVARQAAAAFADAYLEMRQRAADEARSEDVLEAQGRIGLLASRLRDVDQRLERSSGFGSDPVVAALVSRANLLTAQLVEQRAELLSLERPVEVGDVIQPAVVTGRVGATVTRNAFLGSLLGLLLGLAQAGFRGRLDDRVRTVEEAERALGSPILATIPTFAKRERSLSTLEHVESVPAPVSDAFAALRVGLMSTRWNDAARVILVASAGRGEGRTTVAAHLGHSLARIGHRAAVVCADPRRHRLERLFGTSGNLGLNQVLQGDVPVEAAASPTALEALTVLPCGFAEGDSSEPLHSAATRTILDRLVQGDGFVLVDMPPLSDADAVGLLPMADVVLLVVDAGRMHARTLALTRGQLGRAGVPIVGVVLNHVTPPMLRPAVPTADANRHVKAIEPNASRRPLVHRSPRSR